MGFNEQIQLMQAVIEQQKAYIQMQEARMAEKTPQLRISGSW